MLSRGRLKAAIPYHYLLALISLWLVGCVAAGANESPNLPPQPTPIIISSVTIPSVTPTSVLVEGAPTVTPTKLAAPPTVVEPTEGVDLPSITSTPLATPLLPLVEAPMLRVHSWSPDGEVLAYWTFSPEEAAADFTYPPGTLHFLNAETKQLCKYPHQVGYGYADDRIVWLTGGRVLVVTQDQQVLSSTPCGDDLVSLTDVFPARINSIAAYNSDRSLFLIRSEERYFFYNSGSHSVREVAGTIPVSSRAGYSWSPSEQYIGITDVAGMPAHFEMSTYIVDMQTGEVVDTLNWQHADVEGSFAGPIWLGEEQFLIEETLDQGPLLVTMGEEVTQVASTLFGISAAPGQRAAAARVENTNMYHVALWDSTATTTTMLLYHSESDEVEEVPLPAQTWLPQFSLDGRWLTFLTIPTQQSGSYEVWQRAVDPASQAVEHLLDADTPPSPLDSTWINIVVSSAEGFSLLTSDGLAKGVWQTTPYEVHFFLPSSEGQSLALLGYVPGSHQEALFVIPVPE